MKDSIIQLDDTWISVLHTDVLPDRSSILFIHGLGESGLSFIESFDANDLKNYNLIVPDLAGYGRSTSAFNADYSFSAQVDRLSRLIDRFGLQKLFIVGHSMGGDIATLLAQQTEDKILGLVNIEGDLTPYDVFISNLATEAAERGEFLKWFKDEFRQTIVYEQWAEKRESCRRYYASLWFCKPEAFLSNAKEIYEQSKSAENEIENKLGARFREIKMKKLFCWGEESLAQGTRDYIQQKQTEIPSQRFAGAGHWVMIDKGEVFYSLIGEFCSMKE